MFSYCKDGKGIWKELGKTERNSYFVSFGFTDQQNLVVNDTYKRYNVRMNLDSKITDWLKVGTASYFNISN